MSSETQTRITTQQYIYIYISDLTLEKLIFWWFKNVDYIHSTEYHSCFDQWVATITYVIEFFTITCGLVGDYNCDYTIVSSNETLFPSNKCDSICFCINLFGLFGYTDVYGIWSPSTGSDRQILIVIQHKSTLEHRLIVSIDWNLVTITDRRKNTPKSMVLRYTMHSW